MTTIQAIAILVIRLWAVSAIILWMGNLSSTVGMLISGNEIYRNTPLGYFRLASYALIVACWTLVLCCSRRVTLWRLLPMKEVDHKFHIEPEDIIRGGTFMVGIFYLTKYVVKLLRGAPYMLLHMRSPWSPSQIWDDLLGILPTFIGILIALWLTVRPGDIVRLFTWLRTAGQREAAPADDAPTAG